MGGLIGQLHDMTKCKYVTEYFQLGFTYTEDRQGQKSQCVVCSTGKQQHEPSKL